MTKLLKKKWISYLTLAVMLVSLLAGFTTSGYFEPDGKTRYYIGSVSDWEAFAVKMSFDSNVIVTLRSNIDFGDSAPTQVSNTFSGTFEGNGYTITSSAQSAALFKTVSGTVKNLCVAGTFTGTRKGIVAQTLNSGARIENVGVYSTTTKSNIGAIAYTANSGSTVTGCFYKGSGVAALISSNSGSLTYSVFNTTAYTTNGNSSSYSSIEEAAHTINKAGGVYFTVGYAAQNSDTLFKIGTSRDQIVKTTINGAVTYNEPGDEIALSTVDGKTAVVTQGCAYISGTTLYLYGVSDNQNEVVVEYQDAEVVAKAQGKAKLQWRVDHVNDPAFDWDYFSESTQTALRAWLTKAEAALAADTSTGTQYNSLYNENRVLTLAEDAGYMPARYYELYQHYPAVANFSVSTKEDWLAIVDATNMEKVVMNQYTNGNYANLNGRTFHFVNDVDMENTPMLPIGYGHSIIGTINGHGYTLKNINLNVESAYGSVGLVGRLGRSGSTVGIVQNLKVTGAVTVKGKPIYNSSQVGSDYRHEGNRVGAIAGQADVNSIIRKCLVDVDFTIKSAGNVGGVLGDTRSAAHVDGCIVLGETGYLGVVGEGANACKVYNSIYGGNGGIVKYHKNTMGNITASLEEYAPNCHSFMEPIVWRGSWDGWTTATDTLVADYTAAHRHNSILEAAYQANMGYVASGLGDGEQIYFTVDENGNPTFGDENNQIIKINVQDQSGNTINHYYAPSNGTLQLNHERTRNYYAVSTGAGESFIKGSTLTLKNATDGMVLKTDTNVDSGNVTGEAGTVNLLDAQLVLRGAVGLSQNVDVPSGDVNFNARLDSDDAVLIVRHWMGDKSKYNSADYAQTSMDGWYTIVSYNIKALDWDGNAEGGNGYHSYATTGTIDHSMMALADEVAAVINSVGHIDLLGLQEVNQITGTSGSLHSSCSDCYSQMITLESKLDMNMNYAFNWASRSSGGYHNVDYGTVIMTPHTITSTARTEYNTQYSPIYESKQERRVYSKNVVTMTDGSGIQIVWYNTHPGSMVEQQFAELMKDAQAEYAAGKYVVITADFNYWPQGMSQYLDGNFTMANGGTDGNIVNTTTAVTGTAIDNIVISNNLEFYYEPGTGSAAHVVSFDDASVDKTGCDQDWASDHNLVYAYVRVKK